MTRIRVDTIQLRTEAGHIDSIRAVLEELGYEVVSTAASMPSYDGQLSGPARAAGLEAQSRSHGIALRQNEHSQRLTHLAAAFEATDDESVHNIYDAAHSLWESSPFAECGASVVGYDLHPQAIRDRQFLERAGIKLSGHWTDNEIVAAATAVRQLGGKFKEKLEGMGYQVPDEAAAFLLIYGPMTFYYGDKQAGALPLHGYWGISGNHSITFQPGKVKARLVGHELGHELAFLLHDSHVGYAREPQHPVEMLIQEGVWADGEFVTGNRNGSYDRNGGLTAQEGNGYRSDDYHEEWQYHPRSMGKDGNSADEDFADIYLNWTNDSFADNPHGDALYRWADANIDTWLAMAISKKAH
jgi:hypothetical protein